MPPEKLYNSFFIVGNHDQYSRQLDDVTLTLVTKDFSKDRIKIYYEHLQSTYTFCTNLFGKPQTDKVLVVANAYNNPNSLHGSLIGSSISLLMDSLLASKNPDQWSPLLSHELIHLWNGSALKPAQDNLYFTEGFTEYYSWIACSRLKTISQEQLFCKLSDTCERYFKLLNTVSIAKANQTHSNNHNILVYDGGMFFALMLDLRIRQRTNNQYSLDDLMHNLYAQHAYTDNLITDQLLTDQLNALSHSHFWSILFKNHIHSRKLIPVAKLLKKVGLSLERIPVYDTNHILQNILHIQSLSYGSSAAVISNSQIDGYRNGDKILKINNIPVTTLHDIKLACKSIQPEQELELTLVRGSKIITHKIVSDNIKGNYNDIIVTIKPIPDATPKQKRTFLDIFGFPLQISSQAN